jgi:cob(I)alamin adenosyltransferase
MRCGIVQFIKGQFRTGEGRFFRRFPKQVEYHVMGEGYTWETQDRQRDIAAAERAWDIAVTLLRNPEIKLLVFDELNIVLHYGYLDLGRVLSDLAARPPMQHVVITGRNAPQALLDAADTVSEIRAIKHAFDVGIRAQKGIEL